MALISPILDDRTYEQLREELVERIPVYTPEWTNHNESDPGIALLELFAYLGESLLYRFNQIPDTTKIEFLRLLGVAPRTARPAQALVATSTELAAGVTIRATARPRPGRSRSGPSRRAGLAARLRRRGQDPRAGGDHPRRERPSLRRLAPDGAGAPGDGDVLRHHGGAGRPDGPDAEPLDVDHHRRPVAVDRVAAQATKPASRRWAAGALSSASRSTSRSPPLRSGDAQGSINPRTPEPTAPICWPTRRRCCGGSGTARPRSRRRRTFTKLEVGDDTTRGLDHHRRGRDRAARTASGHRSPLDPEARCPREPAAAGRREAGREGRRLAAGVAPGSRPVNDVIRKVRWVGHQRRRSRSSRARRRRSCSGPAPATPTSATRSRTTRCCPGPYSSRSRNSTAGGRGTRSSPTRLPGPNDLTFTLDAAAGSIRFTGYRVPQPGSGSGC